MTKSEERMLRKIEELRELARHTGIRPNTISAILIASANFLVVVLTN